MGTNHPTVIHPVPPGAQPGPGYREVNVTDRGRCFVRPDGNCTTCYGRGTMRRVRATLQCLRCRRTDAQIADLGDHTTILCTGDFHAPAAVAARAAAPQDEHCNCVRRRVIQYLERHPAPAPRITITGDACGHSDPVGRAMRGELGDD